MRRKAMSPLKDWKANSRGRSAALIVGARRVGKSHIVEEFAKKNYKSYLLIDFSKAGDQVKEIFLHQAEDLDIFLRFSRRYTIRRFTIEKPY